MRFEGKTVLVTGAAGGIGRAITAAFRAEGARVAVTDRETASLDADAHLPGDLTDKAFCDALPEAARRKIVEARQSLAGRITALKRAVHKWAKSNPKDGPEV